MGEFQSAPLAQRLPSFQPLLKRSSPSVTQVEQVQNNRFASCSPQSHKLGKFIKFFYTPAKENPQKLERSVFKRKNILFYF